MTQETFNHDNLEAFDTIEEGQRWFEEHQAAIGDLQSILKHVSPDGETITTSKADHQELTTEDLSVGEGSGEPTTFGGEVTFQQGTDHSGTDAKNIGELEASTPSFEQSVEVTDTPDTKLSYGRGHGTLGTRATALGIGAEALGDDNTSVGREAGRLNQGVSSTHLGVNAGNVSENSDQITVGGFHAATGNSEDRLTSWGYRSGRNNGGEESTFVGYQAGDGNTGDEVASFGHRAGEGNTGATLASLGRNAGLANSGIDVSAVGERAANNNSGNRVSSLGTLSARNNEGDWCVGIGWGALGDNTGDGVIAIGARDAGSGNSDNDVLLITDQNGNLRAKMDLTNGDFEIEGSLTENATL